MDGMLKHLVLQLFDRIRTTARTQIFHGFFIEPGTVLRCFGEIASETGKANLSATFLCFPYLALRQLDNLIRDPKRKYPIRTILQMMYPHEPIRHVEHPPAFCKGLKKSAQGVMYVPQLWAVIIGSSNVNSIYSLLVLILK